MSYELIIVDNGSAWESWNYADLAAGFPFLHERNLGFAAGMNSGLTRAQGKYIAFCNNDTRFPPYCVGKLIASHSKYSSSGTTAPAVTEAQNDRTVRRRHRSRIRDRLLPVSRRYGQT